MNTPRISHVLALSLLGSVVFVATPSHAQSLQPDSTKRIDYSKEYVFSYSFQPGFVFSDLSIFGVSGTVSLDHDWWSLLFRYTNGSGSEGSPSEMNRYSNMQLNLLRTQRLDDYSLQFGATFQRGNLWATFAAGPDYTVGSFSESYSFTDTTFSTHASISGFGETAQVTIGYSSDWKYSSSLTGFVRSGKVTYAGVLFGFRFDLLLPE